MNNTTFYIAQGIGAIAIVLIFFAFSSRKRGTLLALKCGNDLLWCVHYFLIGAYSGVATNLLNACREYIFSYREKKKWAQHAFWPYLFVAACLVSSVLTWQGTASLLPALGASFSTVGLWCKEPYRMRLLNLPSLLLWLWYAIVMRTPASILSCSISLMSVIIGLIKDVQERKKKAAAS